MRICIVVDNLNPHAGWGRLALKIAESFRAHGHEVGFIVEKKIAGLSASDLVAPLKLSSLKNLLRLPVTLLLIRNFIKSYDVVFCFDVNPNAIILNMANLWQRRKVVIYALGTYSLFGDGTLIKNFFMRWAYRKAKKVLVVSEFVKRQIEINGFKLKKDIIAPVGVDVNFFHPLLSEEKILPYPFILTVGALKPRKGYYFSISAFSLIAQEFPELKYVIVGDQEIGTYYQEMKSLVHRLGLDNRVIFLEKVKDEDLVRYYNDAKLFILTSVTESDAVEGFGMVYLEASACGTPTIGAYNTGAEAAIKNNSTGILVRHDQQEIADAMRKILVNKNLSNELGNNGIKWASEFNWPNISRIYLENLCAR